MHAVHYAHFAPLPPASAAFVASEVAYPRAYHAPVQPTRYHSHAPPPAASSHLDAPHWFAPQDFVPVSPRSRLPSGSLPMREVLVDEVFEDDASQLHVPIPSRFHDRSHGDSHLDTLEARAEQPLYAHPAPELYTSMPPTALFSPAQSVHFTPAQTVTGSYFDVRGDESDSYQSATPNSMLDNLSLVSPQWISSPLHSPSAHSTGQFAAALASAAPPEIVEPTELSALHVARDRTRSDARSRPYPPPSPVSIASAELDHISIPARDPAPRPPRRGGGRPRTNTAASRENGGRAAREFVYTEERARQFALNDAHIFAVYTRSLDNPKVVISSAQVEELRLIDNDATTMLGQAFRQRQRYEIQRDAIGQLYHFMDKDGAPWQAVVVERRGRKEMDVHAVPGASGSRRATAPPAPETLYHFALFQPQEVTVQPAYKIGDPEWWRIQICPGKHNGDMPGDGAWTARYDRTAEAAGGGQPAARRASRVCQHFGTCAVRRELGQIECSLARFARAFGPIRDVRRAASGARAQTARGRGRGRAAIVPASRQHSEENEDEYLYEPALDFGRLD